MASPSRQFVDASSYDELDCVNSVWAASNLVIAACESIAVASSPSLR